MQLSTLTDTQHRTNRGAGAEMIATLCPRPCVQMVRRIKTTHGEQDQGPPFAEPCSSNIYLDCPSPASRVLYPSVSALLAQVQGPDFKTLST